MPPFFRKYWMNAKELAAKLSRMKATIEQHGAIGIAEAAELIREDAKARIGHYQEGWPPLAPSTVARKTQLGYSPPDNPLLRKGTMRESIEVRHEGLQAAIGSDSDVAVAQEHGTSHIPPRPFILPAAHEKANEAVALIEKHISQALASLFR